ncbi:MAG: cysteine desulfurase family protein [Ignavibacteria bacterium]
MKLPIYLDNHSTTPIDERVLEAMLPYLKGNFGNPSSKGHSFGWIAEEAVKLAREIIAGSFNAKPDEIIFTGGATESNNLAIKGIAEAYGNKKKHLITCKTEHPSVLEVFEYLQTKGFVITYLDVDQHGLISPDELSSSITDKTLLVSIMAANNEIGTIQPLNKIAHICKDKGVFFHTDAAQATGKIELDVKKTEADLISFNAHKNYGPKGTGALFIRKKHPQIKLIAQMHGGGQEHNLRSGTLNVPYIAGLAKAMEISKDEFETDNTNIKAMRDKLEQTIFSQLDGIKLNGHPEHRLPNNLNISINGVRNDLLQLELNDIALSSTAACSSAGAKRSHVLEAIGLSEELIKCTIRIGVGRFNSMEETDYAAGRIIFAVNKIRQRNTHETTY